MKWSSLPSLANFNLFLMNALSIMPELFVVRSAEASDNHWAFGIRRALGSSARRVFELDITSSSNPNVWFIFNRTAVVLAHVRLDVAVDVVVHG